MEEFMCNISIIMPAFNAEKYIKEAINSILSQTYSNFELIIIDDGSRDNTSSIIESYNDKRIVFIKNEKNLGIVDSRNKGIACSKGKYIACMDSDDIALPLRLEIQYDFMENNQDIGLCGGQAISFGSGRKRKPMLTSSFCHYDIAFDLLFKCPFIHPTIFIRKDILVKHKIVYEKVSTEDYQLYARLLKYTKFINLPETLIYYRRHDFQFTANGGSDDSSKSIALAQMSVIEAYNFLFKVNIDLYPYLQKMPTGDSIKCLSR